MALLLLIPLLAPGASAQQGDSGVPEIPIARGAEVDRGDAIAPGFVGVKDGHLWRDGQRLRLWGINAVTEYEPTRTKEQQLRILDRMKAVGFNAIRLHLYDSLIVPEGDAGCTVPTYVKGDGSGVDMLDHFIAGAAERGMVLYMTFDRRRMAILPKAYDLVPAGDAEDKEAWQKTVAELNAANPHPSAWIEQVWPLDERLEQIYAIWVRNLLAHKNLYTGKTYAEDPAIGLWEISNESCYIPCAMDGSSAAFKGYFAKQTGKRWNEFLRSHYHTTEQLKAAWGSLAAGESLEDSSIALEPTPLISYDKRNPKDAKYPPRRVRDLITFLVNEYINANDRILAVIRASAPAGVGAAVVPVGYDTHYLPNLLDMYCAGAGDIAIAGGYSVMRTFDAADPTFPFTSMLATPPAFYGMDLGRIAGKPTVTYEINVHKPAPYRAEFPYVVAAYTSARDWDGVFWYFWMDGPNVPAATYDELKSAGVGYSTTSNTWGGVNCATDILLVSALRLAGDMFKSGAIHADDRPTRIAVGPDELIWSYGSIGSWMGIVREAMRTDGAEIDFNPDETPRDPDLFTPQTPPHNSRLGPDVAIDHSQRQMTVDSDRVKLLVGWPDSENFTFSDGISITGLKAKQFIAFAMISNDGLPIAKSRKLLVSALATGDNTGFKYDPGASPKTDWPGMLESIVSYGGGPAEIVWPALTVHMDGRVGRCTWFNALPEAIGEEPVKEQIIFDGQRPAAWGEVEFP